MKYSLPGLLLFCLLHASMGWSLTADELVQRAERHVRGTSFQAAMTMVVHRQDSTRTLQMRVALSGTDKALVRVLSPQKDRGTGNLRLKLELWQYLANINRIVRIPPSMMLQSWMGSDFTNDELVKASSWVTDYTHKIVGLDDYQGIHAAKVELLPQPNAAVVWGRLLMWLRETDGVPLKQEFYSEHGDLLRVMEGSDLRTYGSHTIPIVLKMTNIKRAGQLTEIRYDADSIVFDRPIASDVFTQLTLKRPVQDQPFE